MTAADANQPRRGDSRPLIAAVAASLLLAVLVFSQISPRADLADFVPAGDSPAGRLMRAEIRGGDSTSLIMAGIEGKEPRELARLSGALAAGLRQSGAFAFVANGHDLIGDAELEWLFRHRYLLSPAVTGDGFQPEALRRALEALLTGLRGSAAPLLARFGFADPTGASLAFLISARGASEVRTQYGVWMAPSHPDRPARALVIARMKTGGLNVDAQAEALAAVRAAFAAAGPGDNRLLLSGPAVLAHDAAQTIRGDVTLLSVVSTVLVAVLLIWRFRSPLVIAAMMVPIVLSVAAAALAVQLAFGFVHAITLGFGMTMLGVTVDYPVLLIGHRKRGEPAPDTLRRIGGAFDLAVLTAALGLTGMVFSSFPGLSQLGLLAVVGVLTAAAVTRWVLPWLIVSADLAPVSAGDPALLARLERLRAWRPIAFPVIAGAAAIVLLGGAPPPERDIAALSPVPEAARALDASLRADLGVPDTGALLVVRGPDAESVLRREEELAPRIDALIRDGVLKDVEAAYHLLPSQAVQEARRAVLPSRPILAARVAEARAGLPFQPDAFEAFLDDVAAAREMPPIGLGDIASPVLRERLRPLLFQRDGAWYGLIVPRGVTNLAQLAAAFPEQATPDDAVRPPEEADRTGIVWLNMRAEAGLLLGRATSQAWRWLGGGAAAALGVLAFVLRDWRRTARVAGAVGAALLVTFAILGLSGARLSLLHIVSLQLVAGVGLDYALFFTRPRLDEEERSRTMRTLITCNGMSLLTFGLLAFCRAPLLREIGVTTAVGVVLAMSFAFLFAGAAAPRVKVRG